MGVARAAAAEYETIATEAQQSRWVTLLETAGLGTAVVDDLVETDSFLGSSPRSFVASKPKGTTSTTSSHASSAQETSKTL